MPVTNTTPNRNYQLPATGNDLNFDINRLLAAFGAIDTDVAALLGALAGKAPLASPGLTGAPTAPTASPGTNTTQLATTAFVAAALANLVNSAPGALDTLAELADALGDDPNFATTVTNAIAAKLALTGGTLTGRLNLPASATGGAGLNLAPGVAPSSPVNGDIWLTAASLLARINGATIDLRDAASLTGTLPNARLPGRLQVESLVVTDWNNATSNGWHMGTGAANAPADMGGVGWAYALTINHGATGYCEQLLFPFAGGAAAGRVYRRTQNAGGWGAWARWYVTQAEMEALLDPRYRSRAPDAVMEDQKAAGTDGGTFTSGAWQNRTLNTKVRDPGSLVSLSSNQFTPSVNGWVEWTAPACNVDRTKSRLYNVTDGVEVSVGSVTWENNGNIVVTSFGGGAVVAGKSYRIEHRCSSTENTFGFGPNAGFSAIEVYTRVSFWRTA